MSSTRSKLIGGIEDGLEGMVVRDISDHFRCCLQASGGGITITRHGT